MHDRKVLLIIQYKGRLKKMVLLYVYKIVIDSWNSRLSSIGFKLNTNINLGFFHRSQSWLSVSLFDSG